MTAGSALPSPQGWGNRSGSQGEEGTPGPQLSSKFRVVDQLFLDFWRQERVPGVAYGVVAAGGMVHGGALGWARLNPKVPVRMSSVFRIASMTKSVTAACVLLLRDMGLLALDDRLSDHLPEAAFLVAPSADSAPITLRQLLTMSSGLVEDDPWADRQLAMTPQALMGTIRSGGGFNRPPGIGFEYSNLGYALLGMVVANVGGRPLSEFAAQRLLAPLGMTATLWDSQLVPEPTRSAGYRLGAPGWEEEPALGDGAFGAMGGLWTTISDFGRYLAFQLDAWPPRDGSDTGPLARASRREMQQPHRLVPSSSHLPPGVGSAGYGFGLMSGERTAGGRVVFHSGGLPGFGSHVQWLPDLGLGVIGFANLTYARVWRPVAEALELLASAMNQPRAGAGAVGPLSGLRDRLVALYQSWDDDLAASISADNLALDSPLATRGVEVRALRQRLGRCREVGPLSSAGRLRGSWRLRCERGSVELEVWLAPPRPHLVQVLRFREAEPAEPGALGGADQERLPPKPGPRPAP